MNTSLLAETFSERAWTLLLLYLLIYRCPLKRGLVNSVYSFQVYEA